EAQAMARLTHPNVVTVHDVGVHDGRLFVAMEFVEGETLRQWLVTGKRPWREGGARFTQAGRGLAAAHGAGIVHRDFKPDNVLCGRDGKIGVADFGLARSADGPAADDPAQGAPPDKLDALTQTGTVLGTPVYMAPEQLRGDPVDARSDQF